MVYDSVYEANKYFRLPVIPATSVTFTDTFQNNTGWTFVPSSGSNISVSGGEVYANTVTANGDNRIHKPLGFTLEDQFVARWTHIPKGVSNNNVYMYVMNFTAGTGNLSGSTNQDRIYLFTDSSSQSLYLRDQNGTTTGTASNSQALTSEQGYYLELVKDGTSGTVYVRSGSHTGTLVNTLTTTFSSGITGLTHVQTGASASGNAGTANYKIENLQIYNGVTSVEPAHPDVRKQHFWDWFSSSGISFTTQSAFNSSGNGFGAEAPISNTQYRRGIKINSGSSAIGKTIKKISTQMHRVGSPTGNISYKVYRSGSVIATSPNVDITTISTSFTVIEYTLDVQVTLQADDRIVAEWDNRSASGNLTILYNNSPSTIASGFSHTSWNGSAWSDSTYDIYFNFDSTPATSVFPSSRWTFKAGAGGVVISQGMSDSIDGGYELVMTNGHIGTYDFAQKRQFNYDGAVIIGVCKRTMINGIGGIGFVGDNTASDSGGGTGYMDRRVTRLLIRNSSLTIQGMTSNASGATYHDTGVTSDNNYHVLKTELTSGGTHFSVDGVLGHSSTGSEHETDEKLQPMFMAWANGSSGGVNINYMEAYNT